MARQALPWLAEAARERELIVVLIEGGPGRGQAAGDHSHAGMVAADLGENLVP